MMVAAVVNVVMVVAAAVNVVMVVEGFALLTSA